MVDLKKKARYDYEWAQERFMFDRLLNKANEFYKNPKNRKAFKKWKQNKENGIYGANHDIT